MSKNLSFLFVVFTLIVISFSAFNSKTSRAQQIPSSAEPDVVIREFEDKRPAPSRLEEIITLPDSEIGKEDISAKKLFVLQSIILDKGSVYEDIDLAPLYQEFIGQQASFVDLNTIARRITVKYRKDGYMFSRAVLPPQKIKDGVVHLEAIEGRVTEVTIIGEYNDRFDLIGRMAAKIKSEGPSNTAELERYLLLIDDLPGIKARSVLQASDTPGGGELIITIEQDDVEGSLGIDNRGSRFLGRYRATAVFAYNSLFKIHDRTTVRGIITAFNGETNELRFADITHEQQVGTNGTRLKGHLAVTSTEPGGSIANLNIEGNSQLLELEALYPLVRSRQFNINLLGRFSHLNTESDLGGIEVSEDHVRHIRAGGTVDFVDSFAGINQFDFSITQGLDVFGATNDGIGRTRANGEHTFTKANLTATRVQDLKGKWSAYLSVNGQYAWDPLLSSEEFTVGGSDYGRAYDSGEIIGDHGLSGVIEMRYNASFKHDYIDSHQFYGFYDVGTVWQKGNVVGESKKESLASAGVGFRFNLKPDVSGYVELNAPLTREINSESGSQGDNPRVFFSLTKRF